MNFIPCLLKPGKCESDLQIKSLKKQIAWVINKSEGSHKLVTVLVVRVTTDKL